MSPYTNHQPLPRFVQPGPADMRLAAHVVDSHPVISAYASCEWDELSSDGRVWIAAVVREAVRQPRPVPGDLIVEINVFLTHMAERFRERSSLRILGFRVFGFTRQRAMEHAVATYDATLDMIGVPFGHPSLPWDRAAAHAFVDDEIQHWEA